MVHRNGVTESKIEKESFDKNVQPGRKIWDERAFSIHIDCLRMMIESCTQIRLMSYGKNTVKILEKNGRSPIQQLGVSLMLE